jgi:tetratricopeptide (TPR) repeat protein
MAVPSSQRPSQGQRRPPVPASLAVAGPGAFDAEVEELVEEMVSAWRRGERPLVEDMLARRPELRERSEAVLRLVYEEVCLREELEPGGGTMDVGRRFPQWRDELGALLECHRLLRLPRAVFPEVGECLGELYLQAELGRGALGRVYLATQSSLADRPVVLKLTPLTTEEHLSLARLQHTHIVPLLFAQDFPERGLRGLCMPWLGGTTLAAVLAALADVPPAKRSGRDLLAALDDKVTRWQGDKVKEEEDAPSSSCHPQRERLAGADYVKAVCLLGADLADALAYAHERGLVHLDLKPANVLLSGDGEAMLLDFHLARAPIRATDLSPPWVGGTPGYMSPEQEAAFAAVNAGRSIEVNVDGRSDVFSLGVVLYEALAGEPPPPDDPARRLRRLNGQVSVGLADVVAHCLARGPGDRYAGAADLTADLRRHLADQPLRGVPNRSLRERWHKWRRRRPLALAVLACLAALAVLAALGVAHAWTTIAGRLAAAEQAWIDGTEQLRQHHHAEAATTFDRGLEALAGVPWQTSLGPSLRRHARLARRAGAAAELSGLVGHLRFEALRQGSVDRKTYVLAAACAKAWAGRDLLLEADPRMEQAAEQAVRENLIDLVLLWPPVPPAQAKAEQPRRLHELEALLGDEAAVAVAAASGKGKGPAPRTAFEHVAVGRALLTRGDVQGAGPLLERACALDRRGFWPSFYLATCRLEQGRAQEAADLFSVCIGQARGGGECYIFRGRAYAAGNRLAEALADFDRALRLGGPPAETLFHKASALLQAGRRDDARRSLEQALTHDARHLPARELLKKLAR